MPLSSASDILGLADILWPIREGGDLTRYLRLSLGLGLSTFWLFASDTEGFTPAQRNFWAFRPVSRPYPPAVKDAQLPRTPIDTFILAKLEEQKIRPNPRADRLTLLRRASIDVTGLLPTPEQVQQFLNDKSSNAWEKVVDTLLASQQYGERWGRHWLDVARYADSNGFKADETRPYIWRYRDYVIQSFNDDKPYNQFVREQIAGDELYPGDPDALVAMGFNRHWMDETNAASLFTRRQETLDDMTTATSLAFIGLTIGCARCHDHKFDPIPQRDYYRLQAFFANTTFGDGPLLPKDSEQRRKYIYQKAIWEEKTKDIRAEMTKLLEPLRVAKVENAIKTFEEEAKTAILMEPAERNPLQHMIYHIAAPRITLNEESGAFTLLGLSAKNTTQYVDLKQRLARFDWIKPARPAEGQFMTDLSETAPPTYILRRGNLDAKGEEVQPGFLSILDPSDAKITPPLGVQSTGRRSALAAWLTDSKNPLVARVMVNRIWHYHFGRGIVATPSDFGAMGARPTHPELLDYLTTYFIDNGWSIKKLHRLIMLSNTYQQSSAFNEEAAKTDPNNNLLWRYQRQRMEAEAIRDSMLEVSGLLNSKMGGPGVFPPVPAGVGTELSGAAEPGGWRKEIDGPNINRRSVYIFVRRNLPYPMLQEFDSANTSESCDMRKNTVTAPQSLELLNNDLIIGWAQHFAGRVLNDGDLSPQGQVDRAFRLAYGRVASAEEHQGAAEFLAKQIPVMRARLAKGGKNKPPMPIGAAAAIEPARAAAFVDMAHMLLASNEFLYIN